MDKGGRAKLIDMGFMNSLDRGDGSLCRIGIMWGIRRNIRILRWIGIISW